MKRVRPRRLLGAARFAAGAALLLFLAAAGPARAEEAGSAPAYPFDSAWLAAVMPPAGLHPEDPVLLNSTLTNRREPMVSSTHAIAGGAIRETLIADTSFIDLPKLILFRDLINVKPGPSGIVWSSDSSMLAAYSDWSDLVTIWNADGTVRQQIRREGDNFGGGALAFVAHNSQIAARPATMGPADVVASVFNIQTGAVVQELPSQQPGQAATVQSALALASSSDGSLLAVAFGGGVAEPVALYDTATWRKLADIPSRDQLRSVIDQAKALAFSRDGHLLAIGTLGEVLIYDVQGNRIARRIKPFFEEQEMGCCVSAVSFNQDATEIAVSSSLTPGSVNGREGMKPLAPKTPVRVIRLVDGAMVASFPDPLWPVHSHSMSWSPDGTFIAFIIGNKLHIWSPSSLVGKHHTYTIRPDATSLAFAPSGKSIAVGNGYYVSVFDIFQ